jgi:hypothetical protein
VPHAEPKAPAPARWLPAGATGMRLNPRARRIAYNGGAAALGWGLGLVGPMTHALDACGRDQSIGAALVLGVGGCLVIGFAIDRRTRGWWPPLAWVARVPLASAVLALVLYAPASH